MILEQHLQVNSNFFYSEKLNFNCHKNFKKVSLKDFNDYDLFEFIETFIFREEKDIFIHLKTNKGEFILLNVLSDIDKDTILKFLKENSSFHPTYYFRNVDYFSYGVFGYANDNKIERYLSYNSEAMEDENVVEWIGKPHKWEYATHTFYTKKKLEDCEMSFDSNDVCDMILYYLPFIREDIIINDFIVYSSNNKYVNKLKKISKFKHKRVPLKTYSIINKFLTKNKINNFIIS